jgi:hyphally-regulated cell wall protein
LNKGLVLVTLGLSVIALSGCGKKGEKKDYKALYNSASAELANKNFETNSLRLALAGYDEKYKDSVDLTQYTIMDTGNIAFNTFNNQIYLDSKVKFQQQDAIQNSIKLNLVGNISVAPTDSWVVRTNTSRTELNNVNGITGNLEVYKIYDTVAAEFIYGNFMQPFIEANNLEVNNMQYLFIGSSKSGVEVTSKVNVSTTEVINKVKTVDAKELYDESELASVQAERVKAEKAKIDASKAEEESLAQKLADASQTDGSSEGSSETSSEANSTEATTEATTEASSEGSSENSAENSSEDIESELEKQVKSQYVDVIVPEYKSVTNEYIFRVGIVMSGENAVVYKFLYKKENEMSCKEIVDNLINSLRVDNLDVSMEK